MYNVLVVDDEPMICKGITSVLMQSGKDISEVFIAHNGFEALDFIRLEKIDLVFTDIQMEKMNGIELIENIFMEHPDIPIVILSAHGEFEYAQKAIRFGAKEYIVKPITPDHLLGVVDSLLHEKPANKRYFQQLTEGRPPNESDFLKRNYLLNELVTNAADLSELDELTDSLGFRPKDSYFCIMVIKLHLDRGGLQDREIVTMKDRDLLKYASLNVIAETVADWSNLVFYSHNSTYSMILQLSEKVQADVLRVNQLVMIGQMLHNNLKNYLNVRSIVGISRIGEGIPYWPALYKEAMDSVSWGGKNKEHHVFFIEDLGKYGAEGASDDKAVKIQIDEANNRFVFDAKAYINSHFCEKGLKLQDIADSVHLSPNYLSYLFKKVMGINIWDYVIKLRMDKGKQLILTTDKRRYEISEEIGYESPEHFSKIFKKHFGINISDLKNTP